MATPVLTEIKERFPDCRISVLGKPSQESLFRGLSEIDQWLPWRQDVYRGLRGAFRLARELRSHRFDGALILPNSFSSALGPYLANIPRRLGYLPGHRSKLLTEGIRPPREGRRRLPEPMSDYYLKLAALWTGRLKETPPRLAVTADEEQRARDALRAYGIDDGEPFACVNPGASFGPSKLWTGEAFAEVCRGLHRDLGLRTLALCAPGEEALAREIVEIAGDCAVDTSMDPLPLDLLKPVLRKASVLITTDTGPRHIAVALKRPVVVVMGPTDPRYTASHLDRTKVLRIDVECGPCHKKRCLTDHRCMLGIQPEWAIQAAKTLMEGTEPMP